MGTNPLIQFVMQPILMFGVTFHFIMGFVLELKNRAARPIKYAVNNGAANASWTSRNMIYSGLFILGFLAFHLWDFWFPEMIYKYVNFSPEDPTRYFEEMTHKFHDAWRVVVYCLTFVFLALHLDHGFQSAFQSLGLNHPTYTPMIKVFGRAFSVVVPLLFAIIPVFLYLIS